MSTVLNGQKVTKKVTCHKCGGLGRLTWALHVQKGVCFVCGGTGKAVFKVFSAPQITDGGILDYGDKDGAGVCFGRACVDWDQNSKYCRDMMQMAGSAVQTVLNDDISEASKTSRILYAAAIAVAAVNVLPKAPVRLKQAFANTAYSDYVNAAVDDLLARREEAKRQATPRPDITHGRQS